MATCSPSRLHITLKLCGSNPPDFHPSVESFDISGALANPASAPSLKPLDTVRIFSRYDFEAPPQVWVGGEVRTPGAYKTSGQAHLRDAVYLAGGLTPDAAMDTAQLFRTQSDGTMKILSVDLHEALAGNPVDNIILQSRDRLLINSTLKRVDAPTVDIRGEVAKPGRYPLTSDMKVQELVTVAGGLSAANSLITPIHAICCRSGSNQHVEISLPLPVRRCQQQSLSAQWRRIRHPTIPQWNDLSASVTLKEKFSILPRTNRAGRTVSSLLARCNGFTSEVIPMGPFSSARSSRTGDEVPPGIDQPHQE